uniref:Uncharacterized protein LOC114341035 isoform X1 n=1 Tax=Diabrotica virgifera virgifera TaxID=50390 RepID=A0A6P7GDQ5_DIAVI
MSFLRAGIQDPQYSHVLSFRRQVYYTPVDNLVIPESILIDFDITTSYRIYLSDGLTCYLCHQSGHIASTCTYTAIQSNPSIPTSQTDQDTISSCNTTTEDKNHSVHNKTENTGEVMDSQELPTEITIPKRSHSEISSPLDTPPVENTEIDFTKPKARSTKKPRVTKSDTKTGETVSTESLIQPAKEFIGKALTLFELNYTEIVSFLDDVHGSPNPLSIAQEYTKNISALLTMLTEIYPKLENRRIKSRITRIKKKIRRQLNLDRTETDNSEDTYVSQENLN